MKKLTLTLVVFIGIFGCDCFNGGSKWNISDFSITVLNDLYGLPLDSIAEGDTALLFVEMTAEFIAANTNNFNEWSNMAYATTCVEDGDEGMEDKIVDLTITSSADFNDIPKGEPLNDILLVKGTVPIEEWIEDAEHWMFQFRSIIILQFIEIPDTPSTHAFTINFTMESGKVISRTSEAIQWN